MAIVLARPGTPSTSTWPLANKATINRSSSMSWPTSSFLTWKTTCSIGAVLGGGIVTWAPVCRCSLLGCACCAAGHSDGGRESEADEELLVCRFGERGDDPDDLSGTVEKWPARIARVDGGVELDEAFQRLSFGDGDGSVQTGDHTGAEGVGEPEGMAGRIDIVTDLHSAAQHRRDENARQLRRLEHGDVVVGLFGNNGRCRLRSVGERHFDRRGGLDDVPSGEDLTIGVDDDAGARSRLVRAGAVGSGADEHNRWLDRPEHGLARRRHVQRRVHSVGDFRTDRAADLLRGERRWTVVRSNERERRQHHGERSRGSDQPRPRAAVARRLLVVWVTRRLDPVLVVEDAHPRMLLRRSGAVASPDGDARGWAGFPRAGL